HVLLYLYVSYFQFFVSSRSRHTRSKRDWSSDVCSSDLERSHSNSPHLESLQTSSLPPPSTQTSWVGALRTTASQRFLHSFPSARSEERRVGKDCTFTSGRPQSKSVKRS